VKKIARNLAAWLKATRATLAWHRRKHLFEKKKK
jgi:hypothetical protein